MRKCVKRKVGKKKKFVQKIKKFATKLRSLLQKLLKREPRIFRGEELHKSSSLNMFCLSQSCSLNVTFIAFSPSLYDHMCFYDIHNMLVPHKMQMQFPAGMAQYAQQQMRDTKGGEAAPGLPARASLPLPGNYLEKEAEFSSCSCPPGASAKHLP